MARSNAKMRTARTRATEHRVLVLAKMDDINLKCRAFRHSWSVVAWWREDGIKRRLLECERCGSDREDKLKGFHWKVYRYVYAEGYLVAKGEKRPTVQQANAELMARIPLSLGRPR